MALFGINIFKIGATMFLCQTIKLLKKGDGVSNVSSVDLSKCSVGDVCWMILKQFRKPIYGEITAIFESENAIQILTNTDGFRLAPASHCFWEEKDAKAFIKKNK